jgi:hypothetical protein
VQTIMNRKRERLLLLISLLTGLGAVIVNG